MAIPKVAPRAVILVGKELSRVKELVAGGTITPGHLIAIDNTGKYVVHPTAAARAAAIFADMRDFDGKGIDDNYVANDNVIGWVCGPGVEVNALVAAAGAAIAIGAAVESAGNGTVRTTATIANAIGIALQAVDNSAGGSPVRIRIMTF